MDYGDAKRMHEYRKTHFNIKIEIGKPRNYTGGQKTYTLLVTGNGAQWSGITLAGEAEVQAVIDQLNKSIRTGE